jgi:hypothetical protein
MRAARREWLVLAGPSQGWAQSAPLRQSSEGDAPDYVTDARDCRGRFYSDAAVEALLRSVEHAFDRFDHGEIELERWRPVVACLDVHTGGTDIVPSTRKRRRTSSGSSSSPCIQTEPSSNVRHRTCRPSSTAIRFEPHSGSSLMGGTLRVRTGWVGMGRVRTGARLNRRFFLPAMKNLLPKRAPVRAHFFLRFRRCSRMSAISTPR